MSKDPAFLFYSSDFLSGVSDLTMEERGQFITLLCLQHQKGHLSKKAVTISVPNVTTDVLSKFKVDGDDMYYNERLELEAKKRADHGEKQRQRALEGWKKRREAKSPGEAPADAAALPLENENENEVIIDNRNKGKKDSKGKKEIPGFDEFKDYALSKGENIDLEQLKNKYEAWKVNGWKTGGDKPKPIQNWKTTLLNTLKYLKSDGKQQSKVVTDDFRRDYLKSIS